MGWTQREEAPHSRLAYTCKNCSYVCAYNCVQLWYTVQHWTVLVIFPLILQTIITAQMVSIGGQGGGITSRQLGQARLVLRLSCVIQTTNGLTARCNWHWYEHHSGCLRVRHSKHRFACIPIAAIHINRSTEQVSFALARVVPAWVLFLACGSCF